MAFRKRMWFFYFLAITLVCMISTANANQRNWGGSRNCLVNAPAGWKGRILSWEGPCQTGKAHGEGVLRGYKKGETTLIFLGQMENGEVSFGVIENSDGYIAGPFIEGKPVPDADRNTIIKAFRKASTAARNFSEHLRKRGNKESADFYSNKAEELEQQMD